MNIKKLVRDTLLPTGVPVSLLVYSGTASSFITYMQYNEFGALYAEESEKETQYSIQVSVYSSGDYTALVNEVYQRMEAAGFTRNNAYDLYDDDLKRYQMAMRFYYTVRKN